MNIRLTITVRDVAGEQLFAPLGMPMPGLGPAGFSVTGSPFRLVTERQGGQWVAVVGAAAGPVTFATDFEVQPAARYPEALFAARVNRFTKAACNLCADARDVAGAAGGGAAGLRALVNHVATLFTYGHPETRFYDGQDEIPALCGLTEGSCVDINAYLIAALRAAGYEAGYVTGYFVPAEKRTHCEDMHCWVVTRCEGVEQDWDVAHHLKMGLREIGPGLNPKPGVRVAMAHSMGHDIPALGFSELKLLSQPFLVDAAGRLHKPEVEVRLEGYDALAELERGSLIPAAAAR